MFSSTATFITRLVEYSFIAGIDENEIDKNDFQKTYKPTCLIGYPESEEHYSQVAELVYPIDVCILSEQSNDDCINFFTTTLTDEKAQRSYIYVLKMYDVIDKIKAPLAICFVSKINDTDSFKKLLNEIYVIISSDYSCLIKQVELINYFMFVHSLLIPPYHTLMTLHMRYMSVDFYFHSHCELPCNLNDTNINMLFSVLDVSTIIKLWLNALREKKIIIYGNKPYLLNAIGDAITRLLFPFKWQHTYISCLIQSQLVYLELPCPYIIGVLSSTIDINDLQKTYPESCIVDLETGHIFAKKIGKLPRKEEILLRKQIQFVKNPELFEEIELFKSEKNNKAFKDVINSKFSFSSNIQRIFFEVIRANFKDYQDYMNSNNTIEEKRFLNSIQSPEIRSIWEKLIKTFMFDYFSQLNKCKDDSYNRIFEYLNMNKINQRNSSNAMKIELTMPKLKLNNLIAILKEMNFEDAEFENIMTQYIKETKQSDFLISARKLSNISLSPCKINTKMSVDDSNSISSNENDNGDFVLIESNNNSNTNCNQKKQSLKKSFHLLYELEPESKANKILTPMIKTYKESNYINTISKVSGMNFVFYSEIGFISFMRKVIGKFSDKKYKLIDLLFKKELLEEVVDCCNDLDDIFSLLDNEQKILEEKEGDDIDKKSPIVQMMTTFLNKKYKSSKYLMRKRRESTQPLKAEWDRIIRFSDDTVKLHQKYLFFAFYLGEILNYPEETFKIDYKELNKLIINYFHQALYIDHFDFPYYRYSTVLSRYPIENLKSYEKNTKLTEVNDIIQDTISNLFKKLRGSNEKKSRQKMDSPRINKKMSFYSPSSSSKSFWGSPSLNVSSENRKSSIFKHHSFRPSNNSIKAFSDEECEFNINFGVVAKQMKKEINENRQSKKKIAEIAQNVAIDHNKEIMDTIKLIPINTSNEFTFKDINLGFDCNFSTPITLNNKKKISQSSEPLSLVKEIGEKIIKLISLIDKAQASSIQNEIKEEFAKIQELVNRLQRVNLAKIAKGSDQFSFWINCFNFLLIYAIFYTDFKPKTFQQWDLLMTNCLYKIGGYKMCLYEIENKILNCHNFHQEEIKFTDSYTQKFCIKEDNILIDFALFFPLQEHILRLTIYNSEQFEEQLYETAKIVLANLIQYNSDKKEINISEYLEIISPHFLEKSFKLFKNYIDVTLYLIIEQGDYNKKQIDLLSWEYISPSV